MSVAILVPVLGRPHRVQPFLDAIAASTPEPHEVLFLVDADDQATRDAVCDAEAEMIAWPWPRPNYPAKINHGARETSTEFVFLGADDIVPQPGWLSAALALMADPAIGVVGTNDGGVNPRVAAGSHSTHSLVRRSYIVKHGTVDRPGQCVHEGYGHAYVDDELITTARYRRAYAHAQDSIVTHLHPYAGTAEHDQTYALGQSTIARDQLLWKRRRRLVAQAARR